MGFFSWKTQDTNKSICNVYSKRKPFRVFMVNPKTLEAWQEDRYEGYGVFGGKDYYELVAEMNGVKKSVGKMRDAGISLACAAKPKKGLIYPVLVEDIHNANKFDGSKEAPYDETQGFFYD